MDALSILLAAATVGFAAAFIRARAGQARVEAALAAERRRSRSRDEELEQLRHDARRLTIAVEQLPVGVAAFDRRGVVLFANAEAARYIGARHGEAVVELRVRRLVEAVAESGTPRTEDFEVHAAGNVHLHVSALPVAQSGDIATLVVIEDRTRQFRTDEIRRDFVANVSHELKSPLGALSVLAEALEGERDEGTRDRLTRRIGEEATRMGRLIEDILDLSQVEAEPFEPAVLSLDEVVRSAAEASRPEAAELGVTLELAVPETGVKIEGDVRQLESAVTNLIGNAIKYTAARPDGGGTVRVSLETDAEHITITVADEGIGIAREHLDRIFERFYRVDRGRSRATGGTGLGLAIVRHVALNHGGRVTVESMLGQGSTFVIELPRTMEAPGEDV